MLHEQTEHGVKEQSCNGCHGSGRGVVGTTTFEEGAPVLEYRGNLMSGTEGEKKETEYKNDGRKESFMFFFSHKQQSYW